MPTEELEQLPLAAEENELEQSPEQEEALMEELLENPETALPDEIREMLPAEEKPPKKRFYIRPEIVMGVIAALAAALLIYVIVLCVPQWKKEVDDPQAPAEQNRMEQIQLPAVQEHSGATEPPESETEPVIPTIPPDPNPYGRNDFQYNSRNYLLLQNVQSMAGVDVSSYQGAIDWGMVKRSGIEFAIIRLGFRGYGAAGRLVEDDFVEENLRGAKKAGLKIGAYFFSQALNNEEVDEEIEFMLKILGDTHLDMPIILDWEVPEVQNPRTAQLTDPRILTNMQLHFCKIMEAKGYQPMVYFNWTQSSKIYYLSELEEFPFWLALYQDRMTYPWKVEMWQYTDRGTVPGISTPVDMNVYMPG